MNIVTKQEEETRINTIKRYFADDMEQSLRQRKNALSMKQILS